MNNKNIDKVAADTKLLLKHLDNLTQQLHSAGLKITFGSIVVVDERNDFTVASHKPKTGRWWLDGKDYNEYLETGRRPLKE